MPSHLHPSPGQSGNYCNPNHLPEHGCFNPIAPNQAQQLKSSRGIPQICGLSLRYFFLVMRECETAPKSAALELLEFESYSTSTYCDRPSLPTLVLRALDFDLDSIESVLTACWSILCLLEPVGDCTCLLSAVTKLSRGRETGFEEDLVGDGIA